MSFLAFFHLNNDKKKKRKKKKKKKTHVSAHMYSLSKFRDKVRIHFCSTDFPYMIFNRCSSAQKLACFTCDGSTSCCLKFFLQKSVCKDVKINGFVKGLSYE